MFRRRELDHLVLDVEFVLISVVQGVALTTLAVESIPVLRGHDPAAVLFIASGLLFVLAFWSGALIHAISFVRWPMDLVHYFGYFGLALLECLTFAQMERPTDWFRYLAICFVGGLALYAYDYVLIVRGRDAYQSTEPLRRLYRHIVSRQRLEMGTMMPAGIAFNLLAFLVVARRPESAAFFAAVQVFLSLVFLIGLVRSFSQRQRLITACAEE